MGTEADYQKALSDYKAGDYGQARARLEVAVKSLVDSWHAHFVLGVCHLECHDVGLAEASLKRALALSPGSEKTLYYLGVVKRAKGEETAAVEFFARALAINPSFEEARVALAGARSPPRNSDPASGTDSRASGGQGASSRKGANVVIADVSDPATQFPKDWKKYEEFARKKALIDQRAQNRAVWLAGQPVSFFGALIFSAALGAFVLFGLAWMGITGPLEIAARSLGGVIQRLSVER